MNRKSTSFILLTLLFVASFMVDIFTGNADISMKDTWQALLGRSDNPIFLEIIRNYRLPKAITAVVAGAALSLAGLLMQTLFRNPLAGPDVLGVSAGAGLGVAILTMLSSISVIPFLTAMGSMAQIVAAVSGAAGVMILILSATSRIKIYHPHLGMIFGYVAGAMITSCKALPTPTRSKLFVTWTLAAFPGMAKMPLLLTLFSIGTIAALLLVKTLNTMLLGEQYAMSSGLNIRKTRLWIITIASLITGAVTAFTGPIAFVGVVIPHLARAVFDTVNHRTILPATLLLGSLLMLICDIISQIPIAHRTLPINAVTAIFGAPLIVWIVLKRKKL